MAERNWTAEDTAQALRHWEAYQSQHDVSDRLGQAVGIDPSEGRVWFGSDASEVARRRDEGGVASQLYVLRVGKDYYQRKGRRR